jgi:hypothetical protein
MPWYTAREIRYCKHQNLWLITEFLKVDGKHIVMDRFTWPVEGQETGYTEAPKTAHYVKAHASYELICQVVGELSKRLERAGKDGRLLVLEVGGGKTLSQDAMSALYYACGNKRKSMRYIDWLRDRRWKQKKSGVIYENVNQGY